ncbi:hypothetical protein [Erwinia tasmaniensis]|uniref:hypothetical protein n=1 Tax=Erwinia tasmaniensis TaxID=338565 RepID=UPI0002DA98C4|nr:hypothetical protein [Erwinia tasmaniensis]
MPDKMGPGNTASRGRVKKFFTFWQNNRLLTPCRVAIIIRGLLSGMPRRPPTLLASIWRGSVKWET